jgi:hypothetical protein
MALPKFISEEIEVKFADKPGLPQSFIWRGKEYKISEIKGVQRFVDFRKPWWRRRHRDYFLVKTEAGETFEIYFHRGPGRQYWVLFKAYQEEPQGNNESPL